MNETFKWGLNCKDVPFRYVYGQVVLVHNSSFAGQDPEENPAKGVVFIQNILPTEQGYVSCGYSLVIPPFGEVLQLTSKLYPIEIEERANATSEIEALVHYFLEDPTLDASAEVLTITLISTEKTYALVEELDASATVRAITRDLLNHIYALASEELNASATVTSTSLDALNIIHPDENELNSSASVVGITLV